MKDLIKYIINQLFIKLYEALAYEAPESGGISELNKHYWHLLQTLWVISTRGNHLFLVIKLGCC